jgi:hypothetical protein
MTDGGEVGDVPCTASWRQGSWQITITSPQGGEWFCTVIGDGDRPSNAWFYGTPWAIYPGAEWEEQPGVSGGGGGTPVWAVAVFLESPEVASQLTNDYGDATSR